MFYPCCTGAVKYKSLHTTLFKSSPYLCASKCPIPRSCRCSAPAKLSRHRFELRFYSVSLLAAHGFMGGRSRALQRQVRFRYRGRAPSASREGAAFSRTLIRGESGRGARYVGLSSSCRLWPSTGGSGITCCRIYWPLPQSIRRVCCLCPPIMARARKHSLRKTASMPGLMLSRSCSTYTR